MTNKELTADQAINAFIAYCNGENSAFNGVATSGHRKLIDRKMEAYLDVSVYDDGTTEYYYICD